MGKHAGFCLGQFYNRWRVHPYYIFKGSMMGLSIHNAALTPAQLKAGDGGDAFCPAGTLTSGEATVKHGAMEHDDTKQGITCPSGYEGQLDIKCDNGAVTIETGGCAIKEQGLVYHDATLYTLDGTRQRQCHEQI